MDDSSVMKLTDLASINTRDGGDPPVPEDPKPGLTVEAGDDEDQGENQ
jgi:hypothetical protein